MARNGYSQGKRQREQQQADRRQDKEQRRAQRREQGSSEPEIVSAASMMGHLPSTEEAMRAIELRAQTPRGVPSIPCRLFVGGLGQSITEVELRAAFAPYGVVADAVVVSDRTTGQSRGFGFVTMQDRKVATAAIEALDGSVLHDQRVVVNVATDRGR